MDQALDFDKARGLYQNKMNATYTCTYVVALLSISDDAF